MSLKKLTGETSHRIGLFGKLVLQVEETYYDSDQYGGEGRTRWRDATARDLVEMYGAPKSVRKGGE